MGAPHAAVNQGVVAYWYAHAYANLNGGFPEKFADLAKVGLPLRKWVSPHTGETIDPDDGKLDFLGDFTFTTGCNDVTIKVSTSAGEVSLPGTLQGSDGCNGTCCDITICGFECWKACGNEQVCQAIQWILWKSFKLYDCLYQCCPADEMEWMASGLAPFDKNWKELAPFMDVCYFYGDCCLKKAKVRCCDPCNSCSTTKCGSCNKCGSNKSCGSCNKCESKCNSCAKPSCGGCKSVSKCGGCAKPSCNSCAKPSCGGCKKSSCGSCVKPSCGGCAKSSCKSCAKPSCGGCAKPSCGSCNKCGSSAKSACNSCNKSAGKCESGSRGGGINIRP
jgi:hypothetical protein